MKVMVIIRANEDSEAGRLPSERVLREMTAFNEELVKAGVMLAGEGLHPSSKAKRVEFSKSGTRVVDGPFAETKELIAGFWIWQVKSMDDAVAWARRIPNPEGAESFVELVPVFSDEDFGDAMTPELREREQRMRDEIERRPH